MLNLKGIRLLAFTLDRKDNGRVCGGPDSIDNTRWYRDLEIYIIGQENNETI